MTARLLVIRACIECPFSEQSSACFHRSAPGRTRDGSAPAQQGERGYRGLPTVAGYTWPEHAPPPDWCPLPDYAEPSQ
jgi:hypothetical protein